MSTLTLAPTLVRVHPAVRDATLVTAGVVLMALSAQVVVPLPFTPVPLTGQTFGALLLGGAFGAARAVTAFALYVMVGSAGAPVFASGESGVGVLSSPTAGYLAGMLLAVALVGWAAERGWDRRLLSSVGAMLAGSVVIYAVGAAWLAYALQVDAARAFTLGVEPFVIGDVVKLILAGAVLPAAWTLLSRTER